MLRDLCLCYAIQKIHNFSLNKDFMLREFYSPLIFFFSTCVQQLPKRKFLAELMLLAYFEWDYLSLCFPLPLAPRWPWKHTTRLLWEWWHFAPYWLMQSLSCNRTSERTSYLPALLTIWLASCFVQLSLFTAGVAAWPKGIRPTGQDSSSSHGSPDWPVAMSFVTSSVIALLSFLYFLPEAIIFLQTAPCKDLQVKFK